MPNWCWSTIQIFGSKRDTRKLCELLRTPASEFDLNAAVPMPDDLIDEEARGEWAYEHWGVRNSSVADCRWLPRRRRGMFAAAAVEVLTRWRPPDELVREMTRRFPRLVIHLSYEEETPHRGFEIYSAGIKIAATYTDDGGCLREDKGL